MIIYLVIINRTKWSTIHNMVIELSGVQFGLKSQNRTSSPAANDQNCSFFDKSMKLCQITTMVRKSLKRS